MGQKTNPKVFRIGHTTTWNSLWFARKGKFIKQFHQDLQIRKFLQKKLRDAHVANIVIERSPKSLEVILHTAKPGLVIGRGGSGVEELKRELQEKIIKDKKKVNVKLTIKEISRPMLSAGVVAQSIVSDLERRVPYRRAMKRAVDQVMKNGALGVKVIVSGRLNGAEIARSEKIVEGNIPLHTLRADIDYYRTAAHTIYGSVGVKVWIYKGEVFQNVQ